MTGTDVQIATDPVVDIQGLWSTFKTAGVEAVVHKDLDLRIEAGEMLSLVGGSGSGKTVLLRKILGLDLPNRAHRTSRYCVPANRFHSARWSKAARLSTTTWPTATHSATNSTSRFSTG